MLDSARKVPGCACRQTGRTAITGRQNVTDILHWPLTGRATYETREVLVTYFFPHTNPSANQNVHVNKQGQQTNMQIRQTNVQTDRQIKRTNSRQGEIATLFVNTMSMFHCSLLYGKHASSSSTSSSSSFSIRLLC